MTDDPTTTFLVEFPNSRVLMSTWCGSVQEAVDLGMDHPNDDFVVYAHAPVMARSGGKLINLVMQEGDPGRPVPPHGSGP